MNDQAKTVDQTWPDRTLTENQQRIRQSAELIPVRRSGAQPENFAQLVDYANWMSKAREAVPAHLLSNVGACLAVIEIANKFNYPAYMVARQTYIVNNMLTFMGQFIMAVINDFCPLQRRLQFRFEGDGATLRVIVTGHFKGEVDPVEYTSPTFAEIKVRNSPLWATDPKQQFRYFGARRWQSAYWPEGLFGIYSPDDIMDAEPLRYVGAENAKDITAGAALHERLKGAQRSGEGFADGVVERGLNGDQDKGVAETQHASTATETTVGAPASSGDIGQGADGASEPAKPAGKKRGPKAKAGNQNSVEPPLPGAAEPAEPAKAEVHAPPPSVPRTVAEYRAHVERYCAEAKDLDTIDLAWKAEKDLRGTLSVIGEDYDHCYSTMMARKAALRG